MRGVDYVFHLAAESRIQPAILKSIEAVSVNCGAVIVLQCAREATMKKQFIPLLHLDMDLMNHLIMNFNVMTV